MKNQKKTVITAVLLFVTITIQSAYAQRVLNSKSEFQPPNNSRSRNSGAPSAYRPQRGNNHSDSSQGRMRITITHHHIRSDSASRELPPNLKKNWAVFARSKPNVTLNTPGVVVVIGEVHNKQNKENLRLIKHLGPAGRVMVYKEGLLKNQRQTLGQGYLAEGVENEKLYNETGYVYEKLLILQDAINKANFNPDPVLAKKYLLALHDFNTHETLRALTAAGHVAQGPNNKTKALIMGFEHVLGTRTPALLPELTRLGVDWIALVPRKLEVSASTQLPRVLTTDNIDKLYKLYNEGNVSPLYYPYYNAKKFRFIRPKPVTNQDLTALIDKLSRTPLRPYNDPTTSIKIQIMSD